MKIVTVTGRSATFGIGDILALTTDQMFTRAHNLEVLAPLPDSELTSVVVRHPVHFKMGEEITLIETAGINKSLFLEVAPADSKAAKKAARAQAEKISQGHDLNDQREQDMADEEDRRREAIKAAKRKKPTAKKSTSKPPKAAGLGGDDTAAMKKAGTSNMESQCVMPEVGSNQ